MMVTPPLPMEIVAPVWPLISLCTPYYASTHQWIIFRLLVFSWSATSQVSCRYWSRRRICFQKSLSEYHTLVVINEMVGWIYVLARLLINRNFATSLWNRMSRLSLRYLPILFIFNRCSVAGLATVAVTSLGSQTTASLMYLVINTFTIQF